MTTIAELPLGGFHNPRMKAKRICRTSHSGAPCRFFTARVPDDVCVRESRSRRSPAPESSDGHPWNDGMSRAVSLPLRADVTGALPLPVWRPEPDLTGSAHRAQTGRTTKETTAITDIQSSWRGVMNAPQRRGRLSRRRSPGGKSPREPVRPDPVPAGSEGTVPAGTTSARSPAAHRTRPRPPRPQSCA